MRKKILVIFSLMAFILTTACDGYESDTFSTNFPEYNLVLTDDEYNALFYYNMGRMPKGFSGTTSDFAQKRMDHISGGAYADIGRIDDEDIRPIENLPVKKSIKEILKRHAKEKWVEAGGNNRYELNITVDENGMTAIISDSVNQCVIYEFNISMELLEEAERYNYLIYEIPGSDESIYFYCRNEDYITVRTISGDYPENYTDRFYNFIPEGTKIDGNPDVLLQDTLVLSGYKLLDYRAKVELEKKDGIVSGTITYEEGKLLNYYTISFSGVIENGILEFDNYERLHFARCDSYEKYMQQDDSISGYSGKIYFYRTFLLFEDSYTGNAYAFGYDKIK